MTNNLGDENKPSTTRIVIWIAVGAVGAYFLISGLVGALT